MKYSVHCQNVPLLSVIGVLALLVPSLAAEDFRYPESTHGHGELRYVGDVPVLTVCGSHKEMGEQIGVLALKPAKQLVELVDGFAATQIPASARPIADFAMQSMYNKFPEEYREEIEAMADAAGVETKSLVMANTIIDLQELVGCSSLLINDDRSTTDGPLYGRNMDMPYIEGLAKFSLLIIYKPDEGHAFAMPNLPGFLMLASGINDTGLALGSQSVGRPKDGSPRFNTDGTASAVAARRLMEQCADIEEAANWLEENRLCRGVSIAACDPKQHAVFEVTTQRLLTRRSEDGLSCATNHFRCPELAQEEDCRRYAHLETMQLLDRVGIERIAEALNEVNQGKMTVHTMIFEPKSLRIHLAMGDGPATELPLRIIDLAEFFDDGE